MINKEEERKKKRKKKGRLEKWLSLVNSLQCKPSNLNLILKVNMKVEGENYKSYPVMSTYVSHTCMCKDTSKHNTSHIHTQSHTHKNNFYKRKKIHKENTMSRD